VIIKRERSGKWFAIFQVEDKPVPLPKTGRAIGIDVGVRHFLTDSKGGQVENPRFYEDARADKEEAKEAVEEEEGLEELGEGQSKAR
jgi:transposase